MEMRATINELINPVASTSHSLPEKLKPTDFRSSAVAASIVGTASKNENSVADTRSSPRSIAPTILEAERETPGITAID